MTIRPTDSVLTIYVAPSATPRVSVIYWEDLRRSLSHRGKPGDLMSALGLFAIGSQYARLIPLARTKPLTLAGFREYVAALAHDNTTLAPLITRALVAHYGAAHMRAPWQLYEREYPTRGGGFVLTGDGLATYYSPEGLEGESSPIGEDGDYIAACDLSDRIGDPVI